MTRNWGETQAEWACPLGGGEGAIPTAAPMREQQVFTAWKEELNWDKRLLERIADPGNLRRAYRKVKSNGGSAGVDGMTIGDAVEWLRTHPGEMRQNNLVRFLLCIDFQYPRALRHCRGLR